LQDAVLSDGVFLFSSEGWRLLHDPTTSSKCEGASQQRRVDPSQRKLGEAQSGACLLWMLTSVGGLLLLMGRALLGIGA
jgi:hypothetical protein